MLGLLQKCRQSTYQVVSVRLKVTTKSFSFANSATTLAKELLISRHTFGPIRRKTFQLHTLLPYEGTQAISFREKLLHCTLCNYSCKTTSNLKTHMATHSEGKPFNCIQCNFSCKTASNLKTHMRTHLGEKPFRCTQCKYSCTCTHAGTQRRHMRTHSAGGKPPSCTHCNYSCTDSSTMIIHKRSHVCVRLCIQGKIAHIMNSPVHSLVPLRYTCSLIPEKSLSTVSSATFLCPCRFSQETHADTFRR